MAAEISVRGGWDRLRYTLLFEALLVCTLAPILAVSFEREVADTGAMSLVLSLQAMVVNVLYNLVYDRVDVHYGRVPTQRSPSARAVHAIGFETILLIASVPIVMWWLGLGFWQALVLDLALMGAVVVYTFLYTLGYDRVFPVAQPAPAA